MFWLIDFTLWYDHFGSQQLEAMSIQTLCAKLMLVCRTHENECNRSKTLSYAIVIQLLYHQGGLESVAEWLVTTHCFG